MQRRWGIIGFGEAGSTFARHLLHRGETRLLATDPRFSADVTSAVNPQTTSSATVQLVPDIRTVVQNSDLCLSLVTPRAAGEVAEAAARYYTEGLFIDFNSISPMQKRQIASRFPEGVFVGGAILGSIAGEGASSQLALDGPAADRAEVVLNSVAFNCKAVSQVVGAAAALKLCRSIFMKGVECLLIETLLGAKHFQISEAVLQNLQTTFQKYGFSAMVEMLVTTHALHCGRRADEMQQVSEMLSDIPLPNIMSEASRALLSNSSSSAVTEHFGHQLPGSSEEVIRFLYGHYREDH